jgi:hypothetical protein
MKLDICHVKISFEMRCKSNMLKNISWKLKSSDCSSVIAFKNLSRIVILCDFQNIWNFLVFVTISIHSWLLFTLIAYWLAINEEMPLKSIISFSWIKFLEYPLSQLKSLKLVQRCMNWNDIVISSILFSRWYDPMWIISTSFKFLTVPQVFPKLFHNSLFCQNRSIQFCKPDCPILDTRHIWFLGQILEALTGHIQPPGWTCPAVFLIPG